MWKAFALLGLIASPCPYLYAEAAGDLSCSSATADGKASEQCGGEAEQAMEQQAFIQTKNRIFKKVDKDVAIDETSDESSSESDDIYDDSSMEEEPQVFGTYDPYDLSTLQTSNLLQQVDARLHDDGRRATVSFVSAGESHQYEMEAVSAYSAKANISIWNGETWEYMHPGKPRTFRAIDKSKFAAARINEDGSVSGLFDMKDGGTIDVRPVDAKADGGAALLEAYTGEGRAHVFSVVPELDLGHNPYEVALNQMMDDPDGEPPLPPVKRVHNDEEVANMPHAEKGASPQLPSAFNRDTPWGGVKWYPGCYKGDNELHMMDIGFALQPTVFRGGSREDWPNVVDAKPRWEEIITKASFAYEKQMNIRLQLSDVKAALKGGPAWAFTRCPYNLQRTLNEALETFKKVKIEPEAAAWHVFTNCKSRGAAGLGFLGTLCQMDLQGDQVNKGANLWQSGGAWLIFAHELGHNFAGKHSFEAGKGRTGGIMDYGNGKLNGHYQFNTRYRKKEICEYLNKWKDNCGSGEVTHFKSKSWKPPPPMSERPPCSWTKHEKTYSGGYAKGVKDKFSLEDGKRKCFEIGNSCRGVTCGHGRTTGCTVRAGDLGSYRGEDTYTLDNKICNGLGTSGGSPPPPPPPSGSGSGGGSSPSPPGSGSGGGSSGRRRRAPSSGSGSGGSGSRRRRAPGSGGSSPSPPGSGSGGGSGSRRRRAPGSGSGGGSSPPPPPPPAPTPGGKDPSKWVDDLDGRLDGLIKRMDKIDDKLR